MLVLLTAALALDAAVVAVRYAAVVHSDRAGDAVFAAGIAVVGAAGAALAFRANGRVGRGAAAALLVPFAVLTLLVGLLSLADGEAVSGAMRVAGAAGVLLLIRPVLFSPRSSRW